MLTEIAAMRWLSLVAFIAIPVCLGAFSAIRRIAPINALVLASVWYVSTIAFVCPEVIVRDIAALLFISEATVRAHVSNVRSKLDLRDRIQAVVHAYEHRIVTPSN